MLSTKKNKKQKTKTKQKQIQTKQSIRNNVTPLINIKVKKL